MLLNRFFKIIKGECNSIYQMPKYNQSKTQKKLDRMKRWRTLRRELKGAVRNGDCLESFRYLSRDGYPELQVSQGYSGKRTSIPIYVLIVWCTGTKLPALKKQTRIKL